LKRAVGLDLDMQEPSGQPAAEPAPDLPERPSPPRSAESPEAAPGPRRAVWLASTAILLAVTALFMPFWTLSDSVDGGPWNLDSAVLPRAPDALAVRPSIVYAGDACLAAGALLLALRVAGRSNAYEPATWRRDLVVASCLFVACLALWWLAPRDPFWGHVTLYAGNATQGRADVQTQPGLAWWTVLACAGLAGIGRWMSRPDRAP